MSKKFSEVEQYLNIDEDTLYQVIKEFSNTPNVERGALITRDHDTYLVHYISVPEKDLKEESFKFELDNYLDLIREDKVVLLVHSHLPKHSLKASSKDLDQCAFSAWDWVIVQPDNYKEFTYIFSGLANDKVETLRLPSQEVRVRIGV